MSRNFHITAAAKKFLDKQEATDLTISLAIASAG